MVWPGHVIEISVLDLVVENTRGQLVTSMVLDFAHKTPGGAAVASGKWNIVRRMPLANMICPQFVRIRDDKGINPKDLRLEQVTALVDVP
jgi:hypothetical protein